MVRHLTNTSDGVVGPDGPEVSCEVDGSEDMCLQTRRSSGYQHAYCGYQWQHAGSTVVAVVW